MTGPAFAKDIVMKSLNALAAGAILLLSIAALPRADQSPAGQATSPQASAPPAPLTAEGNFGAKKDTYVRKSKDEIREWQKKVHDFGETAGAKGHDADAAAKSDLQKAWANTEAQSHKLETAGADGWEGAKASFEKASRHLKDTWHKFHPDDE